MSRVVDETAPPSPPAGLPVPADSGYASRDEASSAGAAAPDGADLACALEAAVVEDAGRKSERQRRLFEYVNHAGAVLRCQRGRCIGRMWGGRVRRLLGGQIGCILSENIESWLKASGFFTMRRRKVSLRHRSRCLSTECLQTLLCSLTVLVYDRPCFSSFV